MRKAKIVCTTGPATETAEQIQALVDAGMDVAAVDPRHVHTGVHQGLDLLRGLGGGSGGTDDLCFAHGSSLCRRSAGTLVRTSCVGLGSGHSTRRSAGARATGPPRLAGHV